MKTEICAQSVDNTLPLTATMPYTTLYYLCILVVSMTISISTAECPRTCECKWKNGKESVACLNANLTAVPTDLDSGTQVLDLTENSIGILRDQVFSKAGLVNLQKIFLVKCRLKSIEKYAFENLINLVELDLSYNILSDVPSASFESISELRELRLNANPIQTILNKAFISTAQLTKLELSNCKITYIETNSFMGLENTLEWLKIDNNHLSEVEASSFTILHSLHGLELAGNPWNCSCKLGELRQWMERQNVPYNIPPICQSPKRIINKSWKSLRSDDFACPPKIHPNKFKIEGIEGKNVTLSCKITGIPRPNVTWLLRNKVIANLSNPIQTSAKKVYIVNEKPDISELTIYNADLQDTGIYTCAAGNKAGKSEAVLTLTVSKKSLNINFSNKALLVSVLLGVAFAVLCCLLAACLVSVRKRRLLKWHTAECRRDDANYEKIEMKQKACHRNLNGDVNREDSGLVTITRKNGDYCVVPGTDTDHENDEEEESTLEITTPGTSNDKKWVSEEMAPQKNDAGMGTAEDVRDTISRTYSSTYGTYKTSPVDSKAIHTTASSQSGQADVKTIYTTIMSLHQVPDVIGHSSLDKTTNSRTQSEHGSANDINALFCTLPRKRDFTRYRSSDSQSPLLPESRYGSDSSSENFPRRFSVETQKYPVSNLQGNSRCRNHKQPSGSMLNLTREEKLVNLSATPLLDIKGLETRLSPHQPQYQTDLRLEACNPYDYHAAQLEKFLEEYRTLQKELTKMKETCDSICQGQMRGNISPCTTSNSSSGGPQVNSPNSNSIQDSVDFKNFENELTKYLLSTKNITSGALHN